MQPLAGELLGRKLFRYWCWAWADVCGAGETLAGQRGRVTPDRQVTVQLAGRSKRLGQDTLLMDPWSFGRTRLQKKTSLVQYTRGRFQKQLSSLKRR